MVLPGAAGAVLFVVTSPVGGWTRPGYSPGTPEGTPDRFSLRHRAHDRAGPTADPDQHQAASAPGRSGQRTMSLRSSRGRAKAIFSFAVVISSTWP